MCRQQYNDNEIRRFVNFITDNFKQREIVEIRAIGVSEVLEDNNIIKYDEPVNYAGYFKNIDELIKELHKISVATSIYFQLNRTNISNFDRSPNKMSKSIKCASEEFVDNREIILIDLDPERDFKGPSTKEKHKQSYDVARNIAKYLHDEGFKEPIICSSGNGTHLYYKVNINKDKENTTLIKNFLKTINRWNDHRDIKVDCGVFDVARICKLPGTVNCKTDYKDIDENGKLNKRQLEHRMAKVLYYPEQFENTDIETIKTITVGSQDEETEEYNVGEDNIESQELRTHEMIAWLEEEGHGYIKVVNKEKWKQIELHSCLLTEDHDKSYKPAFLIFKSGAITYKCLGERCVDLNWKEFKEKYGFKSTIKQSINDWEEPIYSHGIDVAEIEKDMVPELFYEYSKNLSERVSCPIDYPIMSLYAAFGGVIGRRYYCQPYKNNTSFRCFPTIFSIACGKPSVRKTPGTEPPMQILQEIDRNNQREYQEKNKKFKSRKETTEELIKQVKIKMKSATTDKEIENLQMQKETMEQKIEDETPKHNRIMFQEGTVEKITEMLSEDSYGMILYRDEIYATFRNMLKAGRETDRQFYLALYNGNGTHTDLKVGRGITEVNGLCGSFCGTTQPSRLKEILSESISTGTSDGLMARFMIIWPNDVKKKVVDIAPDEESNNRIKSIMKRINKYQPKNEYDEPEPTRILLSDEAYDMYIKWQEELIKREEEGFEMQAIGEMIGKSSGTLPKIAEINYLVDLYDNKTNSCNIEKIHMEKAIKYLDYVESHAQKAYSSNGTKLSMGSDALLKMIYDKEVKEGFKLSEVYRKERKYLRKLGQKTSREVCQNVVNELILDGWVRDVKVGRTITYKIHPQFNTYYEKLIIRDSTERTVLTKNDNKYVDEDGKPIGKQVWELVNGTGRKTIQKKIHIIPQTSTEQYVEECMDII
jgi:hypothetical protein